MYELVSYFQNLEPDVFTMYIGVLIAFFALIIAIFTLYFTGKSVRELISTQRAQTGPLLKASFGLEPYDPNFINPPATNLDFLPFLVKNYNLIIGELDVNSYGVEKEHYKLVLNMENLQSHLSGIASDIRIELIGWWLLVNDDTNTTIHRLIHLTTRIDVLKPSNSIKLNAPGIGKLSAFRIEVRDLSYRDIWGHTCRAFFGHKGCMFEGIIHKNKLNTWESVVPDSPKKGKDPIYHGDYFMSLMKEKFIGLFFGKRIR